MHIILELYVVVNIFALTMLHVTDLVNCNGCLALANMRDCLGLFWALVDMPWQCSMIATPSRLTNHVLRSF